ncbi:ABC transporter substrate-binding protein [Streptosporangium amethystogenes]|uniref:ABC transporter substrate-binding protein n=1 Tax=Streptosporangium amethystogenes TaxID=2002 RepID=UPI0004C60D1D|nr:ABC transporter substrate-binding protein [Streptosporangium amethystogenes]
MKKPAIIALLSSSALVLSACGGGASPVRPGGTGTSASAEYADNATFTMAIAADPGALDPATAVQGSTNLLLSHTYDTLTYIGRDGGLVPGLAESWQVEPSSVTFTLRKNVTCADGSPLGPAEVARSVNHVADPATKSPLLGVLIPAGVRARADETAGTVTLSTPEASPFLLHSTVAVFIVCGKGLTDPATLATTTSGSGPYQLTESVPGDHYTLTVRKGYTWGPGGSGTGERGIPQTVVLKVVSNESTAANLLLAGSINAATFSGADRARVENAPGITKTDQPGGNGEFFYNQGKGRPGADPAVRKALSQAVNLDELAKISTQGTGAKTTGMTTLSPRPCRADSVTGHRPAYDPEAAKATLDAAGWKAGADGIRQKDGRPLAIKVIYNTDYGAGPQAGAEYQADAWKKIGAAVQLKGSASGAWSDALFKTGDWDVSTVAIGVSLPSQLTGYLSGPTVPDGSNFANIQNAKYTELTGKAAGMLPDEGGCDTWAQAESALFDNFDVVPVAGETQLFATKKAETFIPGGLAQPTLTRMLKD